MPQIRVAKFRRPPKPSPPPIQRPIVTSLVTCPTCNTCAHDYDECPLIPASPLQGDPSSSNFDYYTLSGPHEFEGVEGFSNPHADNRPPTPDINLVELRERVRVSREGVGARRVYCTNCWETDEHTAENCNRMRISIAARENVRRESGRLMTDAWREELKRAGYGTSGRSAMEEFVERYNAMAPKSRARAEKERRETEKEKNEKRRDRMRESGGKTIFEEKRVAFRLPRRQGELYDSEIETESRGGIKKTGTLERRVISTRASQMAIAKTTMEEQRRSVRFSEKTKGNNDFTNLDRPPARPISEGEQLYGQTWHAHEKPAANDPPRTILRRADRHAVSTEMLNKFAVQDNTHKDSRSLPTENPKTSSKAPANQVIIDLTDEPTRSAPPYKKLASNSNLAGHRNIIQTGAVDRSQWEKNLSKTLRGIQDPRRAAAAQSQRTFHQNTEKNIPADIAQATTSKTSALISKTATTSGETRIRSGISLPNLTGSPYNNKNFETAIKSITASLRRFRSEVQPKATELRSVMKQIMHLLTADASIIDRIRAELAETSREEITCFIRSKLTAEPHYDAGMVEMTRRKKHYDPRPRVMWANVADMCVAAEGRNSGRVVGSAFGGGGVWMEKLRGVMETVVRVETELRALVEKRD